MGEERAVYEVEIGIYKRKLIIVGRMPVLEILIFSRTCSVWIL